MVTNTTCPIERFLVSATRMGRRLLAGATASAVVFSPLAIVAVTAAPANAAPVVEVNLVAVNDFHGRIDANTVEVGRDGRAASADDHGGQHPAGRRR